MFKSIKNPFVWFILGICVVICLGANTAYRHLQTQHARYNLLRAEADEDSSTVTLTTAGNYANKPSGAVQLDCDVNGLQIIICGGSAANKTFSWTLYLYRTANGPAEYAAEGTGILGTQQVVYYPDGGAATSKFWADTLVITNQDWLTNVSIIDAGGDNRVGKILLDTCGYAFAYLEITSADGVTGDEAGDISGYYSYY